jgi:hypothetical protein
MVARCGFFRPVLKSLSKSAGLACCDARLMTFEETLDHGC